MVRVSSRILILSAVIHSLRVVTQACPLALLGFPTSTQAMTPCPGASDQKSTPLTPLILSLRSIPSRITSPWQTQPDFWWTWSVVSPELLSIGQARVSGTPPGALSGQKKGLATSGPGGTGAPGLLRCG